MDSIPSLLEKDEGHHYTWAPDANTSTETMSKLTSCRTLVKAKTGDFRSLVLRQLVLASIVLSFLMESVAGQRLIKSTFISKNVTLGVPTSLGGEPAKFPIFRPTVGSDSKPLFAYTLKSQAICVTGSGTKFFRFDGTSAGSLSCGNGDTVAATFLKNDRSFFLFYYETDTGNSAKSVVYTLSYSSGLYSINDDKKMEPDLPNIAAAIGEDNTDYVYYFTEDSMAARFNQQTGQGTGDPAEHTPGTVTCPAPNTLYFHPTQTTSIVYFGLCATPQIAFFDKSSLTEVKNLLSPGGTGEGAYTHTLNNLDATVMYMAGNYRAYWIDIATSTTEWIQLGELYNAGSGTNLLSSNFINFGTYQFVGFFISTGTWPFNIYYKGNYTIVPSTYYPAVVTSGTYQKYTALGPVKMTNTERYVVSLVSNLGYNMQSLYFDIDTCTTRTSNICSACPTGSYIDQPAVANNWCFKEGFGVDLTIVAPAVATDLAACSDPICANCNARLICTRCKRNTPQPLIYNDVCQYPPPVAMGRGATEYWEACTVQYCIKCTEDKTYCDACDPVSKTTARLGLCVLPPTVPIGMGANWITGYADNCNTTSCLDCFNDHMTCLKCDVSKEYYLEGTWCKYWSDIAHFKGGDWVSGTVINCLDRGCVDCRKNYTLCTECKVLEEYYLYTWYCVRSE